MHVQIQLFGNVQAVIGSFLGHSVVKCQPYLSALSFPGFAHRQLVACYPSGCEMLKFWFLEFISEIHSHSEFKIDKMLNIKGKTLALKVQRHCTTGVLVWNYSSIGVLPGCHDNKEQTLHLQVFVCYYSLQHDI